MRKSYTLNQFYLRAQELIQKHQVFESGYALDASFEMIERKGATVLRCTVKYAKDFEYKFYGSGETPETAILFFEKDILKTIGESHKEDVSVEYTDRIHYQLMSKL